MAPKQISGNYFGWAGVLAATFAGGLTFDRFILAPRGFPVTDPDHWITLAAFLITATIAGGIAARSQQRRIEAEEAKREVEKVYRLVNALLDGSHPEETMAGLAEKIAEIFEAEGVAVYSKHNGEIVRAGPRAGAIPEDALLAAASPDYRWRRPWPGCHLTPILQAGEVAGSVAITGTGVSPQLVRAVAGRVGLDLARSYAIERTTEADVVRRAEELKSAVLDTLAHELRNPLNSLKIAATTLLSAKAAGEAHKREMLAIIDEEVDRMDGAIEEAVQLARSEADHLPLHKGPQDIGRLIASALEEMSALTAGRAIRVTVRDPLPAAECDRSLIVRVIKQLVSNALKYSPQHSPLTVSAELAGEAIVVHVLDRGPGVAEDERGRIFDKYYRGRASRRGAAGTGLGLASAKCIVEAHGGDIWVTEPPDGGAAFHVSLPAAGPRVGVL